MAARDSTGRRGADIPGGAAEPGSAADKSAKPVSESPTPESRARDIVYRLLAVRARSYAELKQALLRKEIEDEVAESVLAKFVRAGLVDDAEFAESWVRARHRQQGLGRKALGFELRRKGVSDELIADALSTVDADAEEEQARELVRRKLRTMSRLEDSVKMRRLVSMLARKGYSEGLSYRIVRSELEQSEVD